MYLMIGMSGEWLYSMILHQEEPEVCTVTDFVYTHEEAYLVHWYANWRKWPAIESGTYNKFCRRFGEYNELEGMVPLT